MKHLYNEIEPNANEWLKNLMTAGQIPEGKIDGRPIQQLAASDFHGVTQFHTFAGIGGWPLALRLAGWPVDREVWTGSCPCQPFSTAGKGGGVEDERHLWPEFFRLIKERRPSTVFGEQVASKAGIGWLDGVQTDLEGEGYACGAVIMGAHSVGAPHLRQRIYWVATLGGVAQDAAGIGRPGRRDGDSPRDDGQVQAAGLRALSGLGNPTSLGPRGGSEDGPVIPAEVPGPGYQDLYGGLANNNNKGQQGDGRAEQDGCPEPVRSGPWSDYRIIPCTDGKARRTGSRVFPLAYGLPRGVGDSGSWRKGLARSASKARNGMLKGSGNAIAPALAAEFIRAFLDLEAGL